MRMAASVISGVIPLMMPASADEMYCSLNAKRNQPIAAIGSAAMKMCFQWRRLGKAVRVSTLMRIIVSIPRKSRENTTPAGVSDSSPIIMNRNEFPQIRASTR